MNSTSYNSKFACLCKYLRPWNINLAPCIIRPWVKFKINHMRSTIFNPIISRSISTNHNRILVRSRSIVIKVVIIRFSELHESISLKNNTNYIFLTPKISPVLIVLYNFLSQTLHVIPIINFKIKKLLKYIIFFNLV